MPACLSKSSVAHWSNGNAVEIAAHHTALQSWLRLLVPPGLPVHPDLSAPRSLVMARHPRRPAPGQSRERGSS